MPLGQLSHMVQRALGSKHAESEPDEIKHGGWMMPYTNEEILKDKFDELLASDALLLARVTYQLLAAPWPAMKDQGLIEGFAACINSVRKYLISKTLTEVAWSNTRLLHADLAQEIARLKQEGDRDIIVVGSCDLVHSLPAPQIAEHEWPYATHSLGVALHPLEGRAHIAREIGLVDHQQIRAGDARAAF